MQTVWSEGRQAPGDRGPFRQRKEFEFYVANGSPGEF